MWIVEFLVRLAFSLFVSFVSAVLVYFMVLPFLDIELHLGVIQWWVALFAVREISSILFFSSTDAK